VEVGVAGNFVATNKVNIFKTLKNYLLSVAGNEWIESEVSK
jgi:hypothetical protein